LSPKEWRKRVRGTPRQLGKPFPLMERGDKRDLPTALKVVNEPKELERDDVPLREEVERLEAEVDQAVATEDLERLMQLMVEIRELEKQAEELESPQDVARNKIKRVLSNLAERIKEKPVKDDYEDEEPYVLPERRQIGKEPSLEGLVPVGRSSTGKIIYEKRKKSA